MLIRPQNSAENVRKLRSRIAAAAVAAGRSVDSVTLLAVSKGRGADAIEKCAQSGVEHFGENYLKEALPKIEALAGRELTWHYIGRLQANKTRAVAESFAWVHGIDRAKIAERLSAQRPYYAPPLNVCLQIDVASEASKGGVPAEALHELATAVAGLPRLALRGLMCLPPVEADAARQRHWFALTRDAHESLRRSGFPLDTLSMGMSADFEAAIAEGATIVRIGTAVFGPRGPVQRFPRPRDANESG